MFAPRPVSTSLKISMSGVAARVRVHVINPGHGEFILFHHLDMAGEKIPLVPRHYGLRQHRIAVVAGEGLVIASPDQAARPSAARVAQRRCCTDDIALFLALGLV